MRVGRLRKRVAVQANTPAVGQFGGETAVWAIVANVWGAFAPQSHGSGEQDRAQQQVDVSRTLVTLRYPLPVTLTTANRLVMNGRTFAIDNIMNIDERNRELTVACKEVG
jgi:head-tail adaptor